MGITSSSQFPNCFTLLRSHWTYYMRHASLSLKVLSRQVNTNVIAGENQSSWAEKEDNRLLKQGFFWWLSRWQFTGVFFDVDLYQEDATAIYVCVWCVRMDGTGKMRGNWRSLEWRVWGETIVIKIIFVGLCLWANAKLTGYAGGRSQSCREVTKEWLEI